MQSESRLDLIRFLVSEFALPRSESEERTDSRRHHPKGESLRTCHALTLARSTPSKEHERPLAPRAELAASKGGAQEKLGTQPGEV